MKKFLVKSFIFFLAAFFVLYCFIQVRTIFNSDISTQSAMLYTTEIKTFSECYILRNETVIETDTNGIFNYLVSEGQKLSLNHTVAEIYSSESDVEINDRVNEIDDRIEVLKNSSVQKSYLRTNVSKLDTQINSFISEMYTASSNGEYSLAVQNKNELLTLLNKRQLVVQSRDGYDDLINELTAEKQKLTAALSSPIDTVKSPESGYFYSYVDGYEQVLNTSVLQDLTVDGFFELIETAQKSSTESAVGKIATDFEWYTLCIVNKDEAIFYDSGNYYDLIYPYSSGTVIRSKLYSKISQNDREEVILVFVTDIVPENFNFLRHQKAEIVFSDYTGLKISKQSLRIVDGYIGVYVLVGNAVTFKRCEKIAETDTDYIIDINDPIENEDCKYGYLQMFDTVITDGKNLYDGKMIG